MSVHLDSLIPAQKPANNPPIAPIKITISCVVSIIAI